MESKDEGRVLEADPRGGGEVDGSAMLRTEGV